MKPANIISLVVPCFNEEKSIGIFMDNVLPVLTEINQKNFFDYELIFIDDGSCDDTLKILRELHKGDSKIHFISFSRNFGKEAALYAGIKKSRGNYVCTIDVDMQDPPSLMPDMIDFLMSSDDYACAGSRRVTRKGEPLIRSIFARMFYKLISKLSDIILLTAPAIFA
jgi:glycosyltransferase involved in cell wall biosynthesis